jgi:uncharacterized SAM-binding protein YcdF (DUF218 family)
VKRHLLKETRRWIAVVSVILCLAAMGAVFSNQILWSLGAVLYDSEAPQKSDMIVVLGGDEKGNRILRGAELAREGYAPKVLVSGIGAMYGRHESDLAIDFAVVRGYPRDLFIPFYYAAVSTRDEARADIAELRRRGVHKYILVTSVYHSARASRAFRREGRGLGLEMRSAPAQDPWWTNGVWWKEREGRKIWLTETLKTLADYLGI